MAMILGIGTDIVSKERIGGLFAQFGERFEERILSVEERDIFRQEKRENRVDYLAKRYAAKEAIAKAFGVGIGEAFSFQDATVFNHRSGRPDVALSAKGDALLRKFAGAKGGKVFLSLSDERDYAVAFAVIEAA